MRLFSFLAQNGFIVSTSEARRMAECDRVFINNQPIAMKDVLSAEVFKGDTIDYGKSRIVVSEGP